MLTSKTKRDAGASESRGKTSAGNERSGARTEPRLTVYASTQGSELRAEAGSRGEQEQPHPVSGQAAPRRGPVTSPGARSLAATGVQQKKKEVVAEEEEVASRVAPTLRGWKKRKAQNEVQTLVLIALMFAVPIAVLEAFVINAQSENIAFANKELDGYRYVGPIQAAASAVSLHSGLAARTLSGDADARTRMERAGTAVSEALKAAEQRGAALHEFGLQDPWPRIASSWANLQAKLSGFTPEQSLVAHTELGERLRRLLSRVGEESGLSLDPEAETYYLIIPSLQLLPEASDSLGVVRAQGALAARAGHISAERREALASTIAIARQSLQAASESLEAALRKNAGNRTQLAAPIERALANARGVLDEASEAFRPDRPITSDAGAWSDRATRAIQGIDQLSKAVSARAVELLEARVAEGVRERLSTQGVSLFFVVLALMGLALVGRNLVRSIRERQEHAKLVTDEYKGNQTAILRLMDEMSVIAEGDLTARARVGEDITGAIADAVNVTVAQLHKVVERINDTAGQVTRATQSAQEIAARLTEAANRQTKDIEQAVGSVQLMTRSISEVSTSAGQSAGVARQSLDTTERGAQAVQASVASMSQIRDQIQETSKRIKRLGESSLEIGEIVDLISDISEQTNVLALNAAIQAATAGEAGRGFTVVAEEVQRLAERSAEATKQIGGLVKTIQADTQEAVSAMENSTQGVVEGTKLSDAAGQALKEIEQVTRNLAELIQSIEVSTQMQVDIADEVRKLMHDVMAITRETTDGTHQTTHSMTELSRLTEQLRASVAQFKVA
jgi:methyl-accepting chemotaxis protein